MIMKFTTKQKLILLLISTSLLIGSFSAKLKSSNSNENSQTGLEQQVISMNIFNNSTNFVSSSEIQIKLVQTQQEVNGTNKFVGFWTASVKERRQGTK